MKKSTRIAATLAARARAGTRQQRGTDSTVEVILRRRGADVIADARGAGAKRQRRALRFAADQAVSMLAPSEQGQLARLLSEADVRIGFEGDPTTLAPEALASQICAMLPEFVAGFGATSVSSRGERWSLRIQALRVPQIDLARTDDFEQFFDELDRSVRAGFEPLCRQVQAYLNACAGLDLGDERNKREFARRLQQLLDRLGVAVAPARDRNRACRLIVRRNVFYLDHRRNNHRTTLGGTAALPALRLVAAPENRRRRRSE